MPEQVNRLNLKAIVSYFEDLSGRPHLFIHPVSAEAFRSHSMSLMRGVELSVDTLVARDFVNARQHASTLNGWQNNAFGPIMEIREKGYSEEEILQELIRIEIKMWQILAQWEKENLMEAAERKVPLV